MLTILILVYIRRFLHRINLGLHRSIFNSLANHASVRIVARMMLRAFVCMCMCGTSLSSSRGGQTRLDSTDYVFTPVKT